MQSIATNGADVTASLTTAWDDLTDLAPANVPTPATLALFGLGLAGLVGVRRRKIEIR